MGRRCVAGLLDEVPGAEYAELAGLSHLAHLEDPARYAATLHGYFRRAEPRAAAA